MKSKCIMTNTSMLVAVALTFAWLGMSVDTVQAQSPKVQAKFKALSDAKPKPNAEQIAKYRAEATFSSWKDWHVKAENISPTGHNPYYFPLEPGFKFIMEKPDHPLGAYRKEVVVLEKTEPFDIPEIGKFETAVIQEEEFFDGVYYQQSLNWFAIDKSTSCVYAFGEVSWEIDPEGRKVFVGTWRVGEPDGGGNAEPGLLMPSVFNVGAKYIYDGQEAETYGYTENMESGITMETPAGTFKDVIRVREYSLTSPSDITDKWWCPGVGILKDTSDGVLIASSAVPGSDLASFGQFHRNPGQTKKLVAKINGEQAAEIALNKIPGVANEVKIERIGKHNVYAVEVIAKEDGSEWDVFVDLETGEVVGTDN